jgi:hypothetical protein
VALAEDLDVIERSIRQLQIEWEKFFGGVERKPPSELKARLEALLRRYIDAEIRNNAERFRYQSLVARYNTFSELWSKRLRALEEGRPVGIHGVHLHAVTPSSPPPASPPPTPSEPPSSFRARGEIRVQDPQRDSEAVRALYQNFLEARRQAGEVAAVKFESFQKLIGQQAARILAEKGASAVDFRLETKDGKVSLKAKPVR